MKRRGLVGGIVVPAVLIGLLGVLGTLQYRWLGKVSEAERAQLSRSLTQRARDFADDFDRELTRLYLAAQVTRPADGGEPDWAGLATALERWKQTTRYPQVVNAIYLTEQQGGQLTLRAWDAERRTFAMEPLPGWPSGLEPVRQRLAARVDLPPLSQARGTVVQRSQAIETATAVRTGPAPAVAVVAMSVSPLLPDVPALVVPLLHVSRDVTILSRTPTPSSSPPTFGWLGMTPASVIVELDGDALAKVVLPDLASRHFPETDGQAYRLAVTTAAGTAKYTRGETAGLDAAHADAQAGLFGLRFDLVPEAAARGPLPTTAPAAGGKPGDLTVARYSFFIDTTRGGGSPGTMMARVRTADAGWTLLLRHGAGSLDAAVHQVRLRNLWISFGMLAVLAAGLLLVVRNARRAEQLAARQMDFVATVSHELRTPLAVIRSAAQNLSAGVVADPQQARRYGTLIENEGRRLTDMVEQVLDYAGLEGQRTVRAPRPVDVAAVVEEAAAACRPACEAAGCVLDVDVGDPEQPVPPVMGDEAALGRVVSNLITNAAKHGADGGWIGVKVSSCTVDRGQEVHLTVSDKGRGIEASEVAHIFEAFRRGRHAVERQVHGNGLGLSLVTRVVEAHGGRVAVTSAPGQGATFVVYLPAASAGRAVPGAGEGAAS